MTKILAILTCFNRKRKTENCVYSLVKGNPSCMFTFIIVDDASTDGTKERLEELKEEYGYDIVVLQGSGELFYSGGMRVGMQYALDNLKGKYDYLLMVNDDVEFFPSAIEKIIVQSVDQDGSVVIGATCSDDGGLTYGAIKYLHGIKYKCISTEEWQTEADTFNANCVLIPYRYFLIAKAMDANYKHTLGDFDYGLTLKRNGVLLYSSKEYVGVCNGNSDKNTWSDTSLSRRMRIKNKENVKGAPTRQWFYFLHKNFGFTTAVKGCITPYIRIILGK